MLTRRSLLSTALLSPALIRAASRVDVPVLKLPGGGLQPQTAIAPDGTVHVVYLYGNPKAADVGYVRLLPGSQQFTAPVRVNSTPGTAIALGTVRGARIAIGRAGHVHVAWNGNAPGKSTAMFYTRCDPGGGSFAPQRNVIQKAFGLDGGGAVAADPHGNVYVIWHAPDPANGTPGEAHRRVWISKSTDDGKRFTEERAVSDPETGVCGCCSLTALATAGGSLHLLYRGARDVVHRDLFALTSTDGGATFQTTDLRPWNIGACPMTTASLAAHGNKVLAAFESEKQIYLAPLDPSSKPLPIPGAAPVRKHPSLAVLKDGRILLAWSEGAGWAKGGSLAWQLFSRDLQPETQHQNVASMEAWDSPAAIAMGEQPAVLC